MTESHSLEKLDLRVKGFPKARALTDVLLITELWNYILMQELSGSWHGDVRNRFDPYIPLPRINYNRCMPQSINEL